MDNEHVMQSADVQQEEPKAKRFWKNPRSIALFVAFVLLFSAIGGYTLAYLQMKANQDVKNYFLRANVEVSELYSNRSNSTSIGKDDVYFRNDGTVAAYIRVAVIANWVDENDSTVIYAESRPESGVHYSIDDTTSDADSGWFKLEKNGVTYYYYKPWVGPNKTTKILFDIYKIFFVH